MDELQLEENEKSLQEIRTYLVIYKNDSNLCQKYLNQYANNYKDKTTEFQFGNYYWKFYDNNWYKLS